MIPEGMRDVLPPETGRLRAVETALCGRFEAYGYGEVRTPWLEFAKSFAAVDDDTLAAGYRLHDEQGHELMVRTDMTAPVARLAAERCDDEPLPLRFFYIAPCIRPWAPQRGQDGEFMQAGAELLGLDSAAADAECVTLLCDALSSLGVRDYRITLGSVAFQRSLIESLGLEPEDREDLIEALADRDYPLVESIAANAGLGHDALKSLWRTLELSGADDSLAQARKLARSDAADAAIARLVAVRDLVVEAGFGADLAFDFGLMHDLTYYSGMIFEAYAPRVGLPLATGGRYDDLVRRFGWDVPGVGFAVAVDRLVDALDEAWPPPVTGVPALSFVGGLEEPARAAELRRAGVGVSALPEGAADPAPPRLRRRGGSYELELADGRTVGGSWRDVLRALGAE